MLLCKLGCVDLSLSFSFIHAVIFVIKKKKIVCVLSETLCDVLLLLSWPGHSYKGDFSSQ